jgi:hypothetical protein
MIVHASQAAAVNGRAVHVGLSCSGTVTVVVSPMARGAYNDLPEKGRRKSIPFVMPALVVGIHVFFKTHR